MITRKLRLAEISQGTIQIVRPNSPQDIVRAVIELYESESLRKDMIRGGYERARDFSWTRTANHFFVVLKSVSDGEK